MGCSLLVLVCFYVFLRWSALSYKATGLTAQISGLRICSEPLEISSSLILSSPMHKIRSEMFTVCHLKVWAGCVVKVRGLELILLSLQSVEAQLFKCWPQWYVILWESFRPPLFPYLHTVQPAVNTPWRKNTHEAHHTLEYCILTMTYDFLK